MSGGVGYFDPRAPLPGAAPLQTKPEGDYIDPVCGMTVKADSPHRHVHDGVLYLFCNPKCRVKFMDAPQAWLSGQRPEPVMVPGVEYGCPMHPEVHQTGFGTCPLCGMALEPLQPALDDAENPELVDFRHRFWWTLPLTVGVFVIAMFAHERAAIAGLPRIWIEAVLAGPVVLWAGRPFFERWWQSLRTGAFNMWTLIGTGTGAAWLWSMTALLLPGVFPPAFQAHGVVPVYFEAAAVIVSLTLLGQLLELKARARTGDALRALLRLAPTRARRLRADGTEEEIDVALVNPGDRLRIRPGEQVPVDGVVVDGRSAVDESMVTGESMPVTRVPGDELIGGTLNTDGALVLEARRVGASTVLARIVALVASAQRSRAPMQGLADRVAGVFVVVVVLVAVAALLGWGLLAANWTFGVVSAVSVLIVACPCALGLATPMSIMVASGRAARSGVLFREAAAIERLRDVDTLVIDKTGTLTEGRPAVVEIVSFDGGSTDSVLRVAASVDEGSEHPLAKAIVAAARERGLQRDGVSGFRAVAGLGTQGMVNGQTVLLGTRALLEREGIAVEAVAAFVQEQQSHGASIACLAVNGTLVGAIALADAVKAGTPAALERLRAAGIDIIMATGDGALAAQHIAGVLGIGHWRGDVRPADKLALVQELKAGGHVVAMAGDGINDAPALAAADVGIAMGTGTDVAIQAAPVTLVKGDLRAIADALTISRQTVSNMRQNLVFAFCYNAVGVPIAAGLLYPFTGLVLSPMLAAVAMSLSSVSVVVNALRLGRR